MPDTNPSAPVLEISDLRLSYFTRAGEIPAVMDFNLTLDKGEAVGLVGESGCGKSTVAMGIMRYMGGNGAIVGGSIKFKGRDMAEMSAEELRQLRGSEIAMIYQEPMSSLNPSMTIGEQLMEVPLNHEAGITVAPGARAVARHAVQGQAARSGAAHGTPIRIRSPAVSNSAW